MTNLLQAIQTAAADVKSLLTRATASEALTEWHLSTPAGDFKKINPYEAWPQTLVTSAGTWIITHASRVSHTNAAGGDIVIRRSVDKGSTWITDTVAVGTTDGFTPDAIIQLPDNTIILIGSRITSGVHDDVAQVIFWKSIDDGVTWTEIVRYNWTQVSTIGNVVRTNTGRLIAPYHGDDWGMIYSDNNGLTWTIVSTTNGGDWMMEGRIGVAPDGSLFATGRHSEGLKWFRSTNNGLTWTVGADTNVGDVLEGFVYKNDTIVLFCIDRVNFKMVVREGSITALNTNPTNWGPAVELLSMGLASQGETGYPDAYWLPNGDILLSWYSGWRQGGIFTAVASKSAARAMKASSRMAINPLAIMVYDANKTSTVVDPATGLFMMGVNLPLIEDWGQRGKVYCRYIGKMQHSVAGAVSTLTVAGMGATSPFITVTTTHTTANTEYSFDTGWVEIPRDFTNGSTDGNRQTQLVTRLSASVAGTTTLGSGATWLIGSKAL